MDQVATRNRRCRSASGWRSIMARHEASGLSGEGFCEAEGIGSSAFWRWNSASAWCCGCVDRHADPGGGAAHLAVRGADGHAALVRRPGGAGTQPPGGGSRHRRSVGVPRRPPSAPVAVMRPLWPIVRLADAGTGDRGCVEHSARTPRAAHGVDQVCVRLVGDGNTTRPRSTNCRASSRRVRARSESITRCSQ